MYNWNRLMLQTYLKKSVSERGECPTVEHQGKGGLRGRIGSECSSRKQKNSLWLIHIVKWLPLNTLGAPALLGRDAIFLIFPHSPRGFTHWFPRYLVREECVLFVLESEILGTGKDIVLHKLKHWWSYLCSGPLWILLASSIFCM